MSADQRITRAEMRALRDVAKRTSFDPNYPRKCRVYAEAAYPVAAARCAARGLLDRIAQSENARPNRRRYFFEYRLTAAGAAAMRSAEGASPQG